MLRTTNVKDDACDVIDEASQEIIFTVWRADGETDKSLQVRAGNISRCVNEEIKRNRK